MAYDILIVDDSAVTRAVLKKTIGMTGVEVTDIYQAQNGIEALEVVRQHHIDIIMTDLNMPQMGGEEMLDIINDDPTISEVSVVVITTESAQAKVQRLQEKGVRGFVHKPFSPESIRNVIIQVSQSLSLGSG